MRFQVDGTIWTQLDERCRQAFARLAEDCETQSLARLALHIAQGEYPSLVVDAILEKFEKVASGVRTNLPDDVTDAEKIQALNIQMFEIMNFWGDPSEFYEARSCFINDVFSRRSGLQASLAIIYYTLAEMIGLDMTIVRLPGHFLLRWAGEDGDGEIFVDPFSRGAIRDRDQCRDLLRQFTRGRMQWSDDFLHPVGQRRMLTHHLYDLKGAYARTSDHGRVFRVLNYLLTLHADDARIFRERGMLLADLEREAQAVEDLTTYLVLSPDADDRSTIEAEIRRMKAV